MTEALKFCPFCGGVAWIDKHHSKEANKDRYAVFHDCVDTIDDDRVSISTAYYDTDSEAIAAWNTRAERMCKKVEHKNLTIGDEFLKQSGWDCSECGGRLDFPFLNCSYCPTCGAKVVNHD